MTAMLDTLLMLTLAASPPRELPTPPRDDSWVLWAAGGVALGVAFASQQQRMLTDAARRNAPPEPETLPPLSTTEERNVGNTSLPAPAAADASPLPQTPTVLTLDDYRRQGRAIIEGAVSADVRAAKSLMIIAPTRCGKTTVLYLMLDVQFHLHPHTQCWVWQGKGIEPIHPRIPKSRHYLFEPAAIDTTPVEQIWQVYTHRQGQLEQGVQEFSPFLLIITDWQSIKDNYEVTDPKGFKSTMAKLRTFVLNGAALGITLAADTQTPTVDEWGFGSASIRDNFDVYAVARIAWINGQPRGDVKALPKLVNRDDFVVNAAERAALLAQFDHLRTAMENGEITSSIVLSTVGVNRLGIVPEFELRDVRFSPPKEQDNASVYTVKSPENCRQAPTISDEESGEESVRESSLNYQGLAEKLYQSCHGKGRIRINRIPTHCNAIRSILGDRTDEDKILILHRIVDVLISQERATLYAQQEKYGVPVPDPRNEFEIP